MRKRNAAQVEPSPVYVKPTLTRRERKALAALLQDSMLLRRAEHDCDPLELRLGLRAWAKESRAGWVVSNPMYAQILDRHPELDCSLPGLAWLDQVYKGHRWMRVTLPGVRAELQRRRDAEKRTTYPAPIAALEPQRDLFKEGVTA